MCYVIDNLKYKLLFAKKPFLAIFLWHVLWFYLKLLYCKGHFQVPKYADLYASMLKRYINTHFLHLPLFPSTTKCMFSLNKLFNFRTVLSVHKNCEDHAEFMYTSSSVSSIKHLTRGWYICYINRPI